MDTHDHTHPLLLSFEEFVFDSSNPSLSALQKSTCITKRCLFCFSLAFRFSVGVCVVFVPFCFTVRQLSLSLRPRRLLEPASGAGEHDSFLIFQVRVCESPQRWWRLPTLATLQLCRAHSLSSVLQHLHPPHMLAEQIYTPQPAMEKKPLFTSLSFLSLPTAAVFLYANGLFKRLTVGWYRLFAAVTA